MSLKYSDVRAIITALNPGDEPEAVEARIKQWQRLGVPDGVNVGRGTRCEYTDAMVWQIALISALQNMGIPPATGKELIAAFGGNAVIQTLHGRIVIDTVRIERVIQGHCAAQGLDRNDDSPTAQPVRPELGQPVAGDVAASDEVRELVKVAQEVVDTAFDHYTARNGKRMSIEGDDGEKCWIVPFDQFEHLRATLERLSTQSTAEAVAAERERVALIVQDVCELVPDYAEGAPDVVEISTSDLTVILERHLAAIRAGESA